MNRRPSDPKREYTQAEQNESFIGRRVRAFGDRSREPGDGATWAVVLGSLMWTLLIICFSVAGQPRIAFFTLLFMLAWVVVMGRFGKVNVASILWGSATSDADKPPVEVVVFQSTMAVALISLIVTVIDAASGWNFGIYGIALLATIATFFVVYLRTWLQSMR